MIAEQTISPKENSILIASHSSPAPVVSDGVLNGYLDRPDFDDHMLRFEDHSDSNESLTVDICEVYLDLQSSDTSCEFLLGWGSGSHSHNP